MHVLHLIGRDKNVVIGTIMKNAKVSNSLENHWWSLLILTSRYKSVIRSFNPNSKRHFTQAGEKQNILEDTMKKKTRETERGRWIEKFLLPPGGRHLPCEGAASSKVLPPPWEKFFH